MKFKFLFLLYAIGYLLLAIFSYGFVDTNFPLRPSPALYDLVRFQRPLTTVIYLILAGGLFVLYFYLLRQIKHQKITNRQIWLLIFGAVIFLFFSFPAFSYDIFNYIATAKVTFFYQENPYLVMPIEFVGEPMLKFTHAANKIALYGPAWILLTIIPHFLGLGNILLTLFTFKLLAALFYLGCVWLIWRLSEKSVYSLAFFALNPLVVIETLNSSHNDIVMVFFTLLALYLLFSKKKLLSWGSLLISVGIKYATLILAPVFIFSPRFKKETLITLSCWLLFGVFLLSPLREEIYPWYFIWVIALAALAPKNQLLRWLVFGFTVGLLLRHLPWLYFRNWNPPTPMLKTIFTFAPPAGLFIFHFLKNARRYISCH